MSFILDFTEGFYENNALDDSIDRANRQWMTAFLLFIVIFLGMKQFVGDPIQCFTPQFFSGGQEKYVDDFCWTSSTYQMMDTKYDPLRAHDSIQAILTPLDNPEVVLNGKKRFVSYYQWVPLILTFQAVLFFLPYKVWKSFSGDGGVDIEQILIAAVKLGECHGDIHERRLTLRNLCDHFGRFMKVTKAPPGEDSDTCSSFVPTCLGRQFGCHISIFYCYRYLCMKATFIMNLVVQLYGLHLFLGTGIFAHGFDVLVSIVFKTQWTSSERFPINTLCEFRGQPQVNGYLVTYNVHCVLPINLYNDKLFAIISLLFAVLLVLTVFNFVTWLHCLLISDNRKGLVQKHLKLNQDKLGIDCNSADFKQKEKKFIDEELKIDGCFLLLLIEVNLSSSVTDQIVARLWEDYEERSTNQETKCKVDRFFQRMYYDGEDFRCEMEPHCEAHDNATKKIDIHSSLNEHIRTSNLSEDVRTSIHKPPFNNGQIYPEKL